MAREERPQEGGNPAAATQRSMYATGWEDTTRQTRAEPMFRPSGWTVFSAVMLALAGTMGIINGLIAIIHDEVYVVGEEQIVAFDFTAWGWWHLGLGAVVVIAAFALASGALWARILGVMVAFIHAVSQVAFIEAYPFWSLTIIALDAIVIYGCLVHGKETYTT